MDLIDAATRFVSALAGCTALWVFANHLVDVLAIERERSAEPHDTPTQSHAPDDLTKVR